MGEATDPAHAPTAAADDDEGQPADASADASADD
jgi:hypothetical protein